jgi:hypothetical protein
MTANLDALRRLGKIVSRSPDRVYRLRLSMPRESTPHGDYYPDKIHTPYPH